jgi:hypothetical protein
MRLKKNRNPPARWPRLMFDRDPADGAPHELPLWFLEQLGCPIDVHQPRTRTRAGAGPRRSRRRKTTRSPA